MVRRATQEICSAKHEFGKAQMETVLTLTNKLNAIFHHGTFHVTDELGAAFTSPEMT